MTQYSSLLGDIETMDTSYDYHPQEEVEYISYSPKLIQDLHTIVEEGLFKMSVNMSNDLNYTPLINAACTNNINKVKQALNYGANINHQCSSSIYLNDTLGNSALIWAIANSAVESAIILINHGADLNIISTFGSNDNTAITLACAKGYHHIDTDLDSSKEIKESVDLMLLSSKIDINHRCDGGYTALHYAILHDELELAQKLIKKGADYTSPVRENFPFQELFSQSHTATELIIDDSSGGAYTLKSEQDLFVGREDIRKYIATL